MGLASALGFIGWGRSDRDTAEFLSPWNRMGRLRKFEDNYLIIQSSP
jgi:hypothetical protein